MDTDNNDAASAAAAAAAAVATLKRQPSQFPQLVVSNIDSSIEKLAMIHKAVVQRNQHKIKELYNLSSSCIEQRTADKNKLTPLLVAAKYGCLDSFSLLLEMGANVYAKSARGLNAVQCGLVQNQERLAVSLLGHPQFAVIRDIFGLFLMDNLHTYELANTLRILDTIINTRVIRNKEAQVNHEIIHEADGISKLVDLIKTCLEERRFLEEVGPMITQVMESMSLSSEFVADMARSELPEYQVKLLESMHSIRGIASLIPLIGTMMSSEAQAKFLALHAPRKCLAAVGRVRDEKVMLIALSCMQKCMSEVDVVENFCSDGILEAYVKMLETNEVSHRVQSVIINSLTGIASLDETFRLAVLKVRAVNVLLEKLNNKSLLITETINFIRVMCKQKGDAEEIVRNSKTSIAMLVYVTKHSISFTHQQKAFEILWLVSGSNVEEQRALATLTGPVSLINMLNNATSDSYQLTVVTALCLLSPALYGMQDEIISHGAVPILLSLLQSGSPTIQLESLRTLENCSHTLSLQPIEEMKHAVQKERGLLPLLLKLQAYGESKTLQLQATCTLVALSIGHSRIKKYIVKCSIFSLRNLIKQLNDFDPQVNTDLEKLKLVAKAVCYLVYNSAEMQDIICNTMAVPVLPFELMMNSADCKTSTLAAFQMIILAGTFDKNINRVETISKCVKFLTQVLQDALRAKDQDLQVYICTLMSRLLRTTRLGIAQAMIFLDVPSLLVSVVLTPSAHCQKSAATALNYIIRERVGSREVFRHCRKHKKLFDIIREYAREHSVDTELVKRWNHFQAVYRSSPSRKDTGRRKSLSVVPVGVSFAGFQRISLVPSSLANLHQDTSNQVPPVTKQPQTQTQTSGAAVSFKEETQPLKLPPIN